MEDLSDQDIMLDSGRIETLRVGTQSSDTVPRGVHVGGLHSPPETLRQLRCSDANSWTAMSLTLLRDDPRIDRSIMPGSLSASQLPGATVPRLRSSCDACGSAKVRCDRARPQCSRCVALGLNCIYGISRKFGRPPRRKLRTEVNPNDAVGRAGEMQRLWLDDGLKNYVSVDAEELPQVDGGKLQALPDSRIAALPSGFDTGAPQALRQSSYGCDQLGLDFFNPLMGEEWPQLDIWMPSPSPSPEDSTGEVRGQRVTNARAAHSCPRESYEILADLICPAPDLHAPGTNSAPVKAKLDHVLHFNRKATDRLSRLLECPCAKSGHRVMVHAAIISRILIWYQQAAGLTCSSPEPRSVSALDDNDHVYELASSSPSSDGIADIHTSSLQTLPQTTGFVVVDTPVP